MLRFITVMQAPVVKKYPAKLSLTSFTCFFGLIQFLIIAAFAERDLKNWKIQSGEEVFTILYAVISHLRLLSIYFLPSFAVLNVVLILNVCACFRGLCPLE